MYERDTYIPRRAYRRPRPSRVLVATVAACVAGIVTVLVVSSLVFDGAFSAGRGDDHPHISPVTSQPGPPVPQPVRSCS